MVFEQASRYFLPPALKNNLLHPEYEERLTMINGIYIVFLFSIGITAIFYFNGYHYPYYLFQGLLNLAVLPLYKQNLQVWGHFATSLVMYPIWYYFIAHTGGLYSININILYPFLIGAISAVKINIAPVHIIISILILYLLYRFTPEFPPLGSRLYAFINHCLIMLMTAGTMIAILKQRDKLVAENKNTQNTKITDLNDEVSRRTKELANMRQTLAADFHDETGNMLSAIIRQAALLKLTIHSDPAVMNIVDHIIANSNQLYASSRHFIWNLNNDSDNPQILFNYLTSFGQVFYNQFDVSFSAENEMPPDSALHLEAFAAINLIFIFKEAMNNVIKHSGAKEVVLKMILQGDYLHFSLTDNGNWKEKEITNGNHGLSNMEKRSTQNNFRFSIQHLPGIGTRVDVAAPAIKQAMKPQPV